ncbi:hypothetical protein Naga_101469g2, partial [Nannochloropsis gaditana]
LPPSLPPALRPFLPPPSSPSSSPPSATSWPSMTLPSTLFFRPQRPSPPSSRLFFTSPSVPPSPLPRPPAPLPPPLPLPPPRRPPPPPPSLPLLPLLPCLLPHLPPSLPPPHPASLPPTPTSFGALRGGLDPNLGPLKAPGQHHLKRGRTAAPRSAPPSRPRPLHLGRCDFVRPGGRDGGRGGRREGGGGGGADGSDMLSPSQPLFPTRARGGREGERLVVSPPANVSGNGRDDAFKNSNPISSHRRPLVPSPPQ